MKLFWITLFRRSSGIYFVPVCSQKIPWGYRDPQWWLKNSEAFHHKMFTANLAGTSSGGSHTTYRHDNHNQHHHHKRDSNHSQLLRHQHTLDDSEEDVGALYNQPASIFAHGGVPSDRDSLHLPGDVITPTYDIQYEMTGVHGNAPIAHLKDQEHPNPEAMLDCKTVAYLLCFGAIVIGGIVLIVMAALGHFNNDDVR